MAGGRWGREETYFYFLSFSFSFSDELVNNRWTNNSRRQQTKQKKQLPIICYTLKKKDEETGQGSKGHKKTDILYDVLELFPLNI